MITAFGTFNDTCFSSGIVNLYESVFKVTKIIYYTVKSCGLFLIKGENAVFSGEYK